VLLLSGNVYGGFAIVRFRGNETLVPAV